MKVTVVASGKEVELLHQGFEIVIIQYNDGKQELLSCKEVGLKNRERPRYFNRR